MEYWLVVYDFQNVVAEIANVFVVQASSKKEAEDKVLAFGRPKSKSNSDRRRFLRALKLADLQAETPWAYFF